ncbi:hypothetical protein E2C01_099726 [Portunus trituberculatus]|uniref:Uncharacterized protein n=1 Tax=Portunus trituberculatus TaxID=210409 RepID=A0A5B7KBM9_PORTR|nr:hypothetical protein [Portunus trituberculatus]
MKTVQRIPRLMNTCRGGQAQTPEMNCRWTEVRPGCAAARQAVASGLESISPSRPALDGGHGRTRDEQDEAQRLLRSTISGVSVVHNKRKVNARSQTRRYRMEAGSCQVCKTAPLDSLPRGMRRFICN